MNKKEVSALLAQELVNRSPKLKPLYANANGEVVFNEINTMPGFTAISMYPMLWKDKGYSIESLVETLIEMAKERP